VNPLEIFKRSSLRGTDGVKYLWENFPNVPFFEVPFPVERDMGCKLPLLTEASDPKFLHPYLRIYKALSSTGSLESGKKLLVLGLTENGERVRKVSINISIVLAFEKMKVNLIDLDLDAPALHRLLGMRNLEGLMDHLFLGTPVTDIVRHTNIPDLSLITTGRHIEFNSILLRDISWSSVIDELTPAGGIALGVYSGEGTFDVNRIIPCFDGVILFFSDQFSIPIQTRKWLKKLKKTNRISGIIWSQDILIDSSSRDNRDNLAMVGSRISASEQKNSPGERPALDIPPGNEEHTASSGGSMTENGQESDEKTQPTPETGDDPVVTPESGKKVNLSRKSERKGFELLGPILVIFSVFVVILAALLWWSGYFDGRRDVIVLNQEEVQQHAAGDVEIPGAPESASEETPVTTQAEVPVTTPDEGVVEETEVAAAAPLAVPAFTPVGMFFSINIASYTDPEWAKLGLDKLAGKGLDTYLVPVDISGKGTWTRLMVGSYPDRTQADAELRRLKQNGVLEDGRVVRTPFSYLVGEWGTRGEARNAMTPLLGHGLFPYMIAHEEGGVGKYRVYIGAFEGRDQAASLEKILKANNLHLELVEREA